MVGIRARAEKSAPAGRAGRDLGRVGIGETGALTNGVARHRGGLAAKKVADTLLSTNIRAKAPENHRRTLAPHHFYVSSTRAVCPRSLERTCLIGKNARPRTVSL
jgi:hypothetical protein